MTEIPHVTPPITNTRRSLLQAAASTLFITGVCAISTGCSSSPGRLPIVAQSSWETYRQYDEASSRFVDVEGARLWVTDTGGSGEAIVLLHSHTGSALNWGYQQAFFAEKGFRVIAYSRRGFYGTELTETDNLTTMASGSADLHSVVEALGVEKFHLLGTAAGGMIAADYALSHEDKLLSLTIACSLVGISDDDYIEGTKRLLPKAFRTLPEEYKELSASYILANPDGVEQWKELEHLSKPNPDAFNFSLFRKSANRITRDRLIELKVPTLIVTGDTDPYFPQVRARRVTKMFGNATYRLIPESGHSAYWEQYTLFNQVLLEHILSI